VKTRDEWLAEQDAYMAAYPEIRERLLAYPNVEDVGVGVKETRDELTQQMAFRVIVTDKVPEIDLSPAQRIPDEIDGFRTDVIVKREQTPVIGFNDENDATNYSRKVGGVMIGNDKGLHVGTLGCFARRNSDNSVVFLSNHHVLFSDGASIGAKVGQPRHETACCCTCNEIGEVLDGEYGALDCAIGKLKSGVRFITKIRKILRHDTTTELQGLISGSAAPLSGTEVWKVGARTGLTRGTVAQVAPDVEVHPLAPFPKVADSGDSGSVVVDLASGNVVALLKSIDSATRTLAYATPIPAVLTRLDITIIPSDPTLDTDVADWDEDEPEPLLSMARRTAFEDMAAQLDASPAGKALVDLFRRHSQDVLHLVNHQRAVTVAWHRNQGPTWLAALARSAREPAYRLPADVAGVTRAEALDGILAALVQHGNEALQRDLDAFGPGLRELWAGRDHTGEMIIALEELFPTEPALSRSAD
jgi:hypothetical protein